MTLKYNTVTAVLIEPQQSISMLIKADRRISIVHHFWILILVQQEKMCRGEFEFKTVALCRIWMIFINQFLTK